jgi:hypothetical protein
MRGGHARTLVAASNQAPIASGAAPPLADEPGLAVVDVDDL